MKNLRHAIQKFDDSTEGEKHDHGLVFAEWPEDLEAIITAAYPGLDKLLLEIKDNKEDVNEKDYDQAIIKADLSDTELAWSYEEVSRGLYTY